MLEICLIILTAMIAGGSAFAQPATGSQAGFVGQSQYSSQRPVDHGPFTPEANRAYQGGGTVLEGAPGAPAPTPEPTPPGQTPRNMVPLTR
jgi:hypothetical protein